MFPGIGVLPKSATGSYVVNRGTSSPLSAERPGEEVSPAWEAPVTLYNI